MWRVRDIRLEVARRTGRPVDPQGWKYLQQLGVAPKAKEGWCKYDACWTEDEAQTIIENVCKQLQEDPDRWRWGVRWRRPGYWRTFEVIEEIDRRTGIALTREQFNRARDIGVVPEPLLRIPLPRGGVSIQRAWSDQQVEEILVNIRVYATVREPRGALPQ